MSIITETAAKAFAIVKNSSVKTRIITGGAAALIIAGGTAAAMSAGTPTQPASGQVTSGEVKSAFTSNAQDPSAQTGTSEVTDASANTTTEVKKDGTTVAVTSNTTINTKTSATNSKPTTGSGSTAPSTGSPAPAPAPSPAPNPNATFSIAINDAAGYKDKVTNTIVRPFIVTREPGHTATLSKTISPYGNVTCALSGDAVHMTMPDTLSAGFYGCILQVSDGKVTHTENFIIHHSGGATNS